ncbi:hypothetical protein DSTSK_29860 [Desulforhabdus sp. TSK]|nr:hypothetical protein DSTSK_29860 [Desulforhabdus sp. TSK]
MPERYGPWNTIYSRFYRWSRKRIWDQILSAIQSKADAKGGIDWEIHFVDGTIIRAHQHAAGLKKGTLRRRPLATAREASPPKSTSEPTAAVNS